jgi:murein DD-endopeptidase MepM/ murein hydrolase activator NlpD
MSLKKITIVYLPDGIDAVRQFKVPRALVKIALLLSLSVAVFFLWASNDYLELKKKVPENLTLLLQNTQYKIQLISLAGKIDQINKKVAELKEFETRLKNMADLDDGGKESRFSGTGGSDFSVVESSDSSGKSPLRLASLMHQTLNNLNSRISIQKLQNTELYSLLESRKSIFLGTPSLAPAEGWVSSRFGYRVSPFTSNKEFHSGLDIASRVGTEILSTAEGVVTSVGKSDGLGLSVIINHGYGFKTVYGHLSQSLVKDGQAVKRGQNIALMGNSGRSTGPHLHYQVYLNGVPVNPERYIPN